LRYKLSPPSRGNAFERGAEKGGREKKAHGTREIEATLKWYDQIYLCLVIF
jgi:hypothetical protein